MQDLRTFFESEYPGKKAVFENLIKPIFAKANDTTLTDNQLLSENEKKQIKSFSVIAQVRGGYPITFADVELQDSVALKRSRVSIQNCVRRAIHDNSNAIIFFHFTDSKKEWRVSFVNRQDSNKNSTNAKRYTYLCGIDQHCRTITERFEMLRGVSIIRDEELLDAFSVSTVSDEFFEEYKVFYEDFVQYITGNRYVKSGGKYERKAVSKENSEIFEQFKKYAGGDYELSCKYVRDYVKKFMGRLVFLQFLQKKGWLGGNQNEKWGNGD